MTLSTCHEACSPRRHQSRASNYCTQGHQLMWCHACFRCMRCEQHKSVPQLHTPLCDTTFAMCRVLRPTAYAERSANTSFFVCDSNTVKMSVQTEGARSSPNASE
ncbi:unnamed protein product [Bodo saltans]|uniref:Uncharacterized protein n=1 Tax=Bodo saltans TaxID=75058 RepID=A0A0S4J0V3_BODSA|nr:unnamed protein product [Bodo saltans]|eukprot:CUG06580.1 unnamed protein product [Bodo saltans]